MCHGWPDYNQGATSREAVHENQIHNQSTDTNPICATFRSRCRHARNIFVAREFFVSLRAFAAHISRRIQSGVAVQFRVANELMSVKFSSVTLHI